MRLLSVLLLVGCARSGMRSPGSLRHLSGAAAPDHSDAQAPASEPATLASAGQTGERIAAGAAGLLGARALSVGEQSFRYDCSGMVCAAYASGGQTLAGSSRSLYEAAAAAGVLHTQALPSPGDIAFFDNSYDRNNNRQRDDELTHVAVVEAVDEAGTITLIHLGSRGIVRIQMNLLRADDHAVNSYLRAPADNDGGPRLTGELWRAFGRFWALEEEQG